MPSKNELAGWTAEASRGLFWGGWTSPRPAPVAGSLPLLSEPRQVNARPARCETSAAEAGISTRPPAEAESWNTGVKLSGMMMSLVYRSGSGGWVGEQEGRE
ncbi:hypothetical protein SKAU_G00013870 [Synaphobranchus kaupii]|uniref:Uncharacterized protein n=1 Tax=Synaphobranchus kaupii TaxID=118154 RepID=A0A9Q1JDS2_SYNKA|nr:hypothetical protein SKAU_G00013870 [Synaphobranchus kaupii]